MPRTLGQMATLGTVNWTNPDQLAIMIRELRRRLADSSTPRRERFISAATAELPAVVQRFAIATAALSGAQMAAYRFQSAPRLGDYVHARLQADYRRVFPRTAS